MIYNVTLRRQLIFEDTVSADSEEEAVEIAMERNSRDNFNWRRNGPPQVVCVEPAYDGLDSLETFVADNEELDNPHIWLVDAGSEEWALD